MQPVHFGQLRARGLVHVRVGDHVADREAPAGAQDARGLAQDLRLVAGEVDDAVADDDVDAVVGKRDVLDVALQELGVLGARLVRVAPGQLEHLVGHVEADRPAGRAYPPCRDEDVGAGPRTEVEHRLALVQIGDGGRHSAPEGRGDRGLGAASASARRRGLLRRPARAPPVSAMRVLGRSRPAGGGGPPSGHGPSRGGVALAHRLPADLVGGWRRAAPVGLSSAMRTAPSLRRGGRSSRPRGRGARSRRGRRRAAS